MSNGFKLLRGGAYTLNILFRPYSMLRSSFLPNNPTATRNGSLLFRNVATTAPTTATTGAAQQTATTVATTAMARNVNRVASPTLLVTRLANTIIHRSASNAAAAATAGAHHHNHSKHWNKERLVGAFLLFIIPASVVLENQVTDFLLAATLAIHANWGMHGIFTDYIHGVSLPKICLRLLNVFSVIGFLGLCYFNYYDVGLGTAIKKVWAL